MDSKHSSNSAHIHKYIKKLRNLGIIYQPSKHNLSIKYNV
jgi:hypothetical protein